MHLYLECTLKSKIQNFPAPATTHIKLYILTSLLHNTVFCFQSLNNLQMKAWVQHSHFICCNNLAPFCVWQTVIMTIIWANTSSTHLTFSWISVWSEYHNLLLWTPVLLENGTMPSSPSWFLFPQWSLQVCCLLLLKYLRDCSIRVNQSGRMCNYVPFNRFDIPANKIFEQLIPLRD